METASTTDRVGRVAATVAAGRQRAGLTGKDAAARIGISPQYLNDIERGRRALPPSRVVGVASTLGVDANALMSAVFAEMLPPGWMVAAFALDDEEACS